MALDGAKFICLSDSATEGAETTPASTTVAGQVAGNGDDATSAENNTVIEAKGRKFTVGYYMSCDYVLEDARAEGVHCEIQCDAFGRVTIHNISDSHPISVNGQIIALKRPLLDGSRIKILDRNFLWKFPKSVEVTATGSNKAEVTCNNDDQTSTPQKVIAPEQAPNSCPDLKPHRKVDKRFTVHNFAYCINSDEEGNTSTDLPSINESKSVEETTKATQKKEKIEQTGTETVMSSSNGPQGKIVDGKESNVRRSITPEPQPNSNASTLSASTPILTLVDTPKTNLINCTKNKENKSSEKNRHLISLCQQSDLVITSFSPRETGVRIEKSFTAVLKPIAATTPKSVYSTPKSLIYDSNDEGSRDFIDFTTPATSKKAFRARALAGNSSMHLIDLTTPNKLAPVSARSRTTAATFKRNQTLPTNVKLSTTPLTYAKLAVDNEVEEVINTLPATPNVELPTTIDSDISTPQSAELVISVDGSSSDLSTHVIEISTEDSATPSISSPVRTNLKSTKTPQRTVGAGQKHQLTSTPQRTQTPSLMKRALLTSAKKNAHPTNRSSPARLHTSATPTERNIKLTKPTDSTVGVAPTCSTPKSNSRISIGSPSNVAAAQLRFLSVKPRRSLAAVEIGSPADAKSAITTSTPLNPRHAQTRNLAASAPRLSLVKRTSPLRGVRKSIGGVTLSSHISKTRRSVVSPKNRSSTANVVQHVSKARKTLCIANANRSQVASRSRSLVAAAVGASNKAQTAVGEKTKTANLPLQTTKGETDLSRTFNMDNDSFKELPVEENKLTNSVVAKSKNITFSPIRKDTSETPQRELNKTFSPEKPIIAGVLEIKSEEEKYVSINKKVDPVHISESFAEVVESKEKTVLDEETKSRATNATEPQQQSLEISTSVLVLDEAAEAVNTEAKALGNIKMPTAHVDSDDAQQSQKVRNAKVIEEALAANLTKQSENKNTDQLSTSNVPLASENCDFVEAGSPKPIGDSQGTADFLEEIEYVLNKSDELQQQLGSKEGHSTSDPKAELEKLLTGNEADMAELTTNVDNFERNTKVTEQTDIDVEDDYCLSTIFTAIELPTTSKIIFSVKSNLEEKEKEEDKTSIESDVIQTTFETGASSDIDGKKEQEEDKTSIDSDVIQTTFETGASSDIDGEKEQEEDKTSIDSDVIQTTFETGATSDIDGESIKSELLTITTNATTPSEFDVSSFGVRSMETDTNTETLGATFDAQESINMRTNIELNKNIDDSKLDITNEVSSYLITLKTAKVEEPESTTGEIEELDVSTAEHIESKSLDSSKVAKYINTESVELKGKAVDKKDNIETLDINIKTQSILQKLDETNKKPVAAAEWNEVPQTGEAVIELTVNEPLVMDDKVTTAGTDDTHEKSKIETEMPKVKVCGSKEILKSNSEHQEGEMVTTLQVTVATTEKCESEPFELQTTGDEPINSDDEKENKKVIATKLTDEPILTIVAADIITTALELNTPNISGIRDMLRTPKQNSEVAHATPRTIGLRNLMCTPKASTSAAATSVNFAEDDGAELLKTPQKSKKNTQTRQSTVDNFTPRRSARRRASANPDLTPTRCVTPTLDTSAGVSRLNRTTRRCASASAEVSYTPQRINRRRSSLSLDNEEAIAVALTPRKLIGSSIRGKHTMNTLILECPEAEDMGAIIEEEPRDDVKESNDSKQKIPTLKDIERTELKSIAPSISDVIEDSICEEINAQKMPTEKLKDIVIAEGVKVKETEQVMENADNAQTSIESPILIPFTKLNESEHNEEKVHIAVNPIFDAQEIYDITTDATEQQVSSQPGDLRTDKDVDEIEDKLLDKSDYEYGKEVEHESGDISTLAEQPKTPRTQRKSVRIADNALDSLKTPVMVGMRELMKTPNENDYTPKLIGVRDLMRTPKVAIGSRATDSVDEEEQLTGLADLVKTPEVDIITGTHFSKKIVTNKGENITEEQKPSTSTEARTAFIGMRELLKTPKHTSTPEYRGMRELLRTPKACSTPQLGGLEELMQTPKRTKLNDKYYDGDSEGLDTFFKTPRAKYMMIPGEPSSAILEPSTNSTLNIMSATTEYDLHSSNQRTLDAIYKTPVSTRLSSVDTLTEEDIETSGTTKKEEESEMIVPETPAHPFTTTTTKRNIAATEAFDELDECCTTVDSIIPQSVNTPKSRIPSNVTTASLLSPFSATDIITDLPKSDIQEWVDNLQKTDDLDDGAEEGEVTVSASILNAASDATHDPIAASVCETSISTVNKDTTEQMLANMSAVTTSDDPLLPSALKHADYWSHNTTADNRNETLRPATPNEAEISGLDLLDQTNESVFSEPLVVSDTESLHDDSQENDLVEREKVTPSDRSTKIMSDVAENKSQDEEEFPIMFVESSDSEEDDIVTKTPAHNIIQTPQKTAGSHKHTFTENKNANEGVDDTVVVDLDDSNATESLQKITATNSKTNASESTKDSESEFSNFQAHETIASQQIRASTPNRSSKARPTQSAQSRRRQSMGAEKQLGSNAIDLTHEKSRLVKEKAQHATTADCIVEVDESIEEVIAFENVQHSEENVTKLNENSVELIGNAFDPNENKAELNEKSAELIETAAKSIESTAKIYDKSALLSENVTELNDSLGALNEKVSELTVANLDKNASELVSENLETTMLSIDKIHEEFGNLQAHKRIASRGKRAATPDHVNKRNVLKISQAPRRLTLGAEKHLTGVNIDFLKDKSQLQQSKQLTEHIVESLQEVDDSIDEVSMSKAKQSVVDTSEGTENMVVMTKAALNVEAIGVHNVVELEVEEENSEMKPFTTAILHKSTKISISKLSEEHTKLLVQKEEKVVENIKPAAPALEVIENVVTEATTSEHISKTEAALSTTNNTSADADDNITAHSSEDQTNIALSKTEFNESDIFDLTEEPPKDLPAGNTTQGIIFDLTEGEEEDTQVKKVENNKETESSSKVTNDKERANQSHVDDTMKTVGISKQITESSYDNRAEGQSDAVTSNNQLTNYAITVQQTGFDLPKANNEEFMFMKSMESEEENIEISESHLNMAQAKVEEINELAEVSSKADTHIADSVDFEETNAPLKILDFADSKWSKNELEAVIDEIIDETNVAAGNEEDIGVSATLQISQDKVKDNELEIPENSNNLQVPSAVITSGKVESQTLANVEKTKEFIGKANRESTEDTIQATFGDSLQVEQSCTEKVVNKTFSTAEIAKTNIVIEKSNDHKEVEIQNEEKTQLRQSPVSIKCFEEADVDKISLFSRKQRKPPQSNQINEEDNEMLSKTPMETEVLIKARLGKMELKTEELETMKTGSGTKLSMKTPEMIRDLPKIQTKAGEKKIDDIVEELSKVPTSEGEKASSSKSIDYKPPRSNKVNEDLFRKPNEVFGEESGVNSDSVEGRVKQNSTKTSLITQISVQKSQENTNEVTCLIEVPVAMVSAMSENIPKMLEEKAAMTQEVIFISEENPDNSEKHSINSTEVPSIAENSSREISTKKPTISKKVPSQTDKIKEKVASTSSCAEKEQLAKRNKRKTSRPEQSSDEKGETLSQATDVIPVQENQDVDKNTPKTAVERAANETTYTEERQEPAQQRARKTSHSKQNTDDKESLSKPTNKIDVIVEESKPVEENFNESISSVVETNLEPVKKQELANIKVTETINEDSTRLSPQTVDEFGESTTSGGKQKHSKQISSEKDLSDENATNESKALVEEVIPDVDTETLGIIKEAENEATYTKEKQEPAKRSVSLSGQSADHNKETLSKLTNKIDVIVEESKLVEEKFDESIPNVVETNLEPVKNEELTNIKNTETIYEDSTRLSPQTVDELGETTISRGKQPHSKQIVAEKDLSGENATNESETLVEEIIPEVDTETFGIAIEEAENEATYTKEKQKPAKRNADENKETISKSTNVIEVILEETSDDYLTMQNIAETNEEKSNLETDRNEKSTNLKITERLNEEISTVSTETVDALNEATASDEKQPPGRRKVRKPSRTKQALVVEEVKESKDVDTETQTAVVEEVVSEATSEKEKQQPLKRIVRKTSRSKQKVEQKEDLEYKTTIVEETTDVELVEETPIVGTETTMPLTTTLDVEVVADTAKIISEDESSGLTTGKIEEVVEATTAMPAKRKGRKLSRSKQMMEEKLCKDNKSLVEEPDKIAEKGSQVIATPELVEQKSSVVSVAGEAATLLVKATYEVCLLTKSEGDDKNVPSDKGLEVDLGNSSKESVGKTKNTSVQEIATATKVLDGAESTHISYKQEEELHAQRPTRRTRKCSASSQCSLQEGDHLPTTTKRRAGRRRAETPVENSGDEASAHDEASKITKRRRGQTKTTVEVAPPLEEIKEAVCDDIVELKEQADQCEKISFDTDMVEDKTEDKEVTENVTKKKQKTKPSAALATSYDSAAEENPKESNDKGALAFSEIPRSAEPGKDMSETRTEAESSTMSKFTEISDEVAAELPANATNIHEEEVKILVSKGSTTNTKAPRQAGRRKPAVSESSQSSITGEHVDAEAMQRTRRRRKPTTEEDPVDTVNAAETQNVLNEESPPTNKTTDVKTIKKETETEADDKQLTLSSTSITTTERPIEEKKEGASEMPTISIESSDLKSESQKENIDVKEGEQANEETTTTGRKRVYRRKKGDAKEDQQTENAEHNKEEKPVMTVTNSKPIKVIEDTRKTPVAAESVGGRRGRRGAAAAATVAINEVASAHKRGTPRGKSQQNTSQSQRSQRKGETKQTNTVENEDPDNVETTDMEVKVAQKVVRHKRRGSGTAEVIENDQPKESEVDSVMAKKVTKIVRKRRESLHTEEAENVHANDKHEGDDPTSSVDPESCKVIASTSSSILRTRRKRKNSLQSLEDDEVTRVVVNSAGGAGDDEPPKKRPLSRKRRDSSLDSSIHEVATAAADGRETKASGGNTSSASTTPNRSRNLPRRAVAAEERNYDESSDAEAQVELKRRIEKASIPKGNSNATAATRNKHQHTPTSGAGSCTTEVEMATTTKAEDINKSARNTPILSTILTTSRGGRQRKPTARVQQYLEEERAKAETPKKRLLLAAAGGETPSTSQAASTPARRTRKTSAVEVEQTEAQRTPARGRPRNLKTLATTTTETSEESRSEVDNIHSEHETNQSTTIVEEKPSSSKVGKRATTRRGKTTVSAAIPTESELSEAQEAPTTVVSAGRSGRAAKAAAAAALVTDEQLSSSLHTKPRAVSGRRARRGAHVDTAASDDEQHTDAETKNGKEKKNEKTTKTITDDGAVGRIARAGRGGRRNKQNDSLKSETSSVVTKQQTLVIDADDEHEEEDEVLVDYVDLVDDGEEEDKPLSKVKKATKKRIATVGGSTTIITESPLPKRVRRRGDGEKDADGTQPDTAAGADASSTRSRKIVRFDAESAASNVAGAPTTRATRSRRK